MFWLLTATSGEKASKFWKRFQYASTKHTNDIDHDPWHCVLLEHINYHSSAINVMMIYKSKKQDVKDETL